MHLWAIITSQHNIGVMNQCVTRDRLIHLRILIATIIRLILCVDDCVMAVEWVCACFSRRGIFSLRALWSVDCCEMRRPIRNFRGIFAESDGQTMRVFAICYAICFQSRPHNLFDGSSQFLAPRRVSPHHGDTKHKATSTTYTRIRYHQKLST